MHCGNKGPDVNQSVAFRSSLKVISHRAQIKRARPLAPSRPGECARDNTTHYASEHNSAHHTRQTIYYTLSPALRTPYYTLHSTLHQNHATLHCTHHSTAHLCKIHHTNTQPHTRRAAQDTLSHRHTGGRRCTCVCVWACARVWAC